VDTNEKTLSQKQCITSIEGENISSSSEHEVIRPNAIAEEKDFLHVMNFVLIVLLVDYR
jgi:hypothetical protein